MQGRARLGAPRLTIMLLVTDISDLPLGVRRQMSRFVQQEYQREFVQAVQEQRAAAAHFARNPPQWKDGIGPQVMALHPLLRVAMIHMHGEDSLQPDFWDWVAKQEEATQVHSVSPKTQVGFCPDSQVERPAIERLGERRYRKHYPCSESTPAE